MSFIIHCWEQSWWPQSRRKIHSVFQSHKLAFPQVIATKSRRYNDLHQGSFHINSSNVTGHHHTLNSCFIQIFEWWTKTTLLHFLPEVAQNSLSFPCSENRWVCQVCGRDNKNRLNSCTNGILCTTSCSRTFFFAWWIIHQSNIPFGSSKEKWIDPLAQVLHQVVTKSLLTNCGIFLTALATQKAPFQQRLVLVVGHFQHK